MPDGVAEIDRNVLHDSTEDNQCIVFEETEDDPKTCKMLGHRDAPGPYIAGKRRRKGIFLEVSINGGEAEEMAPHDVWYDFPEAVEIYKKGETLRNDYWKTPSEATMNHWVRVIQVDGITLEEIKSGCRINYGELTHGVVADNGFLCRMWCGEKAAMVLN